MTKLKKVTGRRKDNLKKKSHNNSIEIFSVRDNYYYYFYSSCIQIQSLESFKAYIYGILMAAISLKETKAACVMEHGGGQAAAAEVEFVKCHCCGLTEECTQNYIAKVRERYQGRWICGLCAEAVKDEFCRSRRNISTDEAVKRHVNFCEQFRTSSPPSKPTEDLISAMKQLLRRTLDSPKKEGFVYGSMLRSKSCFPSISDAKNE